MAEATVHIHCRRVDFEKWHALGNDYLILEQAALPFPLTPGGCGRCARGTRECSPTACCCSRPPDEPGFVARLQIFNPDGSEAELSGNGAREAVLYLRRRGWTESDRFRIQTAAGEIQPTITSPTTASLAIGRARLQSADYPPGAPDGIGELIDADRTLGAFSTSRSAIPSARSGWPTRPRWQRSTCAAIGPGIEHHELFPNRTNVSWYVPLAAGPDPGADLRAGRGGDLGQRNRRHAAPPSPTSWPAATRQSRSCWTAASSRSRWGRIFT